MTFPKFTSYKLPNNIKLLFIPINNVETVSISVTINTGYFEENSKEIGIAHFLEHMIARYLRDGPVMKEIKDKGVIISTNATTSIYRTTYYAYGSSKYQNEILKLILDTYNYREIDKKIFENERTAVIVEMKKKMIKKDILAYIKELPIMVFGKNTKIQVDPQKHIDVVSKAKEFDLINFMNRNYLPGKTTITIAGKFSKVNIMKIINQSLKNKKKTSSIQKRSLTQIKEGIFPKIKIIPEQNRKVTKIIISFLIFNSYQYEKRYMAEFLSTILSRIGNNSILFDRLRTKLGVTYSPQSFIDIYYNFGQFYFTLEVEPKNIEKSLIELSKIIRELKTKFLDEQLIKLGKSKLQLDIKEEMYNSNPNKYLKYSDKIIDEEEIINPQQIYNKYYKKIDRLSMKSISNNMFKINKCYMAFVGSCPISSRKIRKIFSA